MAEEEKTVGLSSAVDVAKAKNVDPALEKHAHDADEAMRAFDELQGDTIELDDHTSRRLLRSIDWHMMPIMCCVYGMNYLDSTTCFDRLSWHDADKATETTLSYASIMGLKEDLNLDPDGDQYQWLGSLFYFGLCNAILARRVGLTSNRLSCLGVPDQPPTAVVATGKILRRVYSGLGADSLLLCRHSQLSRGGRDSFLPWSLRGSCHPGVRSFDFSGMSERSVVKTGLTSRQWYTKREQGSRVNIWFSFNGIGQIVGGVLAYGIAVGTAKHGSSIEPWKILFLATGLLTIALGLIFLWIVPDNQLNARWLNEEDRVLAIARVRVNQQGIGNKNFKLYQVKESLLDPMTWAFFLFAVVSNIPNGGISNFFSQLVSLSWLMTRAVANEK